MFFSYRFLAEKLHYVYDKYLLFYKPEEKKNVRVCWRDNVLCGSFTMRV